MRPELKEYNYDWLMAGTLNAAANVPNGTRKETEMTYRYLPSYRNVAESFISAGDPGIQILKLFARYYDNILTARAQGKKIASTTFCFSPTIFYAFDIVPVCMEMMTALGGILWKRGMFDYLDHASELGLPETSCSSQRGAMGAFLSGLAEEIDMYVCDTPGVCDTNANAFAFAAAYADKPYYQLNYPQTIGDDRSQQYHVDDYKELIRFLEEQTGNKFDYDRLAEILKEVEKQDTLIADLEDMHTLKPTPFSPLDNIALYAGRFTFSGHTEYTKLLEVLHKEVRQRAEAGISGLKSGNERLRIFMFYIDHYTLDMNFWNWFEENSIAHMGGLLSHHFSDKIAYTDQLKGSEYSIDTSTPESMLNSVSQINARLPMVRSIRGPYDQPNMWLEESLTLARTYGADCLVYNGTPGCRNTWANVQCIARDLEKQGYPTHIMNDDAFDDRVESWDATKSRLEEFIKVRGLL